MPISHDGPRRATFVALVARVLVTLGLMFAVAVSSEAVAYAVDCVGPNDPAGCTPVVSATPTPTVTVTVTATPVAPTPPAPSGWADTPGDGSPGAPSYVALIGSQFVVLVGLLGLVLVLLLVRFFLGLSGNSFVEVGGGRRA